MCFGQYSEKQSTQLSCFNYLTAYESGINRSFKANIQVNKAHYCFLMKAMLNQLRKKILFQFLCVSLHKSRSPALLLNSQDFLGCVSFGQSRSTIFRLHGSSFGGKNKIIMCAHFTWSPRNLRTVQNLLSTSLKLVPKNNKKTIKERKEKAFQGTFLSFKNLKGQKITAPPSPPPKKFFNKKDSISYFGFIFLTTKLMITQKLVQNYDELLAGAQNVFVWQIGFACRNLRKENPFGDLAAPHASRQFLP